MSETVKILLGGSACALAAYLLGSICFAIIVTKIFAKKDIRSVGSGNAGMTNVLRTVGPAAAAITLILDVAKSVAAVFIGRYLFALITGLDGMYGGYIAGIFAVLGHMFPIWFKFKGGKGVLTAVGMMVTLDPTVFLLAFVVFLIVFLFTRIISASSVTAAIALPIINHVLLALHGDPDILFKSVCVAVIGIMIIIMHRANIGRLLKGTEKKFSVAKSKD